MPLIHHLVFLILFHFILFTSCTANPLEERYQADPLLYLTDITASVIASSLVTQDRLLEKDIKEAHQQITESENFKDLHLPYPDFKKLLAKYHKNRHKFLLLNGDYDLPKYIDYISQDLLKESKKRKISL